MNVDAFGAALALPLRDAAARTVLSMLSVVTKPKIDRLSFLEGQPPAQEIRREVCACFAASIYGECIARGEPHKLAAAKVESVCQRAFPDESAPTATEIGFYIAIAVPVDELAGRVAAHEILMRTTGVVGAIREGKTSMVHSMMGAGKAHGMQIMDDALAALLAAGSIDAREAYMKATEKQRFKQGAA